jgi:hypothetical protein
VRKCQWTLGENLAMRPAQSPCLDTGFEKLHGCDFSYFMTKSHLNDHWMANWSRSVRQDAAIANLWTMRRASLRVRAVRRGFRLERFMTTQIRPPCDRENCWHAEFSCAVRSMITDPAASYFDLKNT